MVGRGVLANYLLRRIELITNSKQMNLKQISGSHASSFFQTPSYLAGIVKQHGRQKETVWQV